MATGATGTKETAAAASTKPIKPTQLNFEAILSQRWLASTPEAARRAILGGFACVLGANAGDGDTARGLAFLRALAAEHLALEPTAVDDVALLATGGWQGPMLFGYFSFPLSFAISPRYKCYLRHIQPLLHLLRVNQ
jgi:hypothetical protein